MGPDGNLMAYYNKYNKKDLFYKCGIKEMTGCPLTFTVTSKVKEIVTVAMNNATINVDENPLTFSIN